MKNYFLHTDCNNTPIPESIYMLRYYLHNNKCNDKYIDITFFTETDIALSLCKELNDWKNENILHDGHEYDYVNKGNVIVLYDPIFLDFSGSIEIPKKYQKYLEKIKYINKSSLFKIEKLEMIKPC